MNRQVERTVARACQARAAWQAAARVGVTWRRRCSRMLAEMMISRMTPPTEGLRRLRASRPLARKDSLLAWQAQAPAARSVAAKIEGSRIAGLLALDDAAAGELADTEAQEPVSAGPAPQPRARPSRRDSRSSYDAANTLAAGAGGSRGDTTGDDLAAPLRAPACRQRRGRRAVDARAGATWTAWLLLVLLGAVVYIRGLIIRQRTVMLFA